MTGTGDDGDPAMHASDTIDYEVVISGKVDLELPGGKKRTLGPGDLLVMAGRTSRLEEPVRRGLRLHRGHDRLQPGAVRRLAHLDH